MFHSDDTFYYYSLESWMNSHFGFNLSSERIWCFSAFGHHANGIRLFIVFEGTSIINITHVSVTSIYRVLIKRMQTILSLRTKHSIFFFSFAEVRINFSLWTGCLHVTWLADEKHYFESFSSNKLINLCTHVCALDHSPKWWTLWIFICPLREINMH